MALSIRNIVMRLIIPILAFLIFITLLVVGKIGEASFCFLVAGNALLGLVLHGFGRLQELDLKNLRVVLREIKETKSELLVREERLKSVVIPLVQIMAYTGASEGRWSSSDSAALKRQWYKKKVADLIESLGFSSEEADEAKKFFEKYEEIDRLFAGRGALQTTDPDYPEVKERIASLSSEINAMIAKDLER